jgi:hypothetical protein
MASLTVTLPLPLLQANVNKTIPKSISARLALLALLKKAGDIRF